MLKNVVPVLQRMSISLSTHDDTVEFESLYFFKLNCLRLRVGQRSDYLPGLGIMGMAPLRVETDLPW